MSENGAIGGLQRIFLENGELHIGGVIDEETAQYVHEALLHLKAQGSPDIRAFFRSNGGSLFAGVQVYDELRHYAGEIRGIANGFCHSAAAIALMGCSERYAYRHAQLLFHKGGFIDIDADDLYGERLKRLRREVVIGTEIQLRILKENTRMSESKIRELVERDMPISASNAVRLGILQGLI